jgi:hypothetical protein
MKESSSKHLRQAIAQQAARMMAEEGVVDYSRAKRKAARQLGVGEEERCLPSNAEVESALRVHHEIFHGMEQPQQLRQLRSEALSVMQLLEQFNPHLAGSVLDGTAGRFAETQIHLFVDSLKDVELFLLNHNIPYQIDEKSSRIGNEKRLLPVFVLEGRYGTVRLVVFDTGDLRTLPRTLANEGMPLRMPLPAVAALLEQA